MREGGEAPAGAGECRVAAYGVADDRDIVGAKMFDEDSFVGDEVDDESQLSRTLCEEAFGVGEFVVVAVVAGVLRADDDEAISSQVRGEVAIEQMGTAATVRDDDEGKSSGCEVAVRCGLEGELAELLFGLGRCAADRAGGMGSAFWIARR